MDEGNKFVPPTCVRCKSTKYLTLVDNADIPPRAKLQYESSDYLCKYCINELKSKYDKPIFHSYETSVPVVHSTDTPTKKKSTKKIITPQEFKKQLDEYVIGQDKAKKILSVVIYNHLTKMNNRNVANNIDKTNVLLLGPTGCGKTYLLQTMANIVNLPLLIIPSTQISKTGWKGVNLEHIAKQLIDKAKTVEEAKFGIIYIDEVDKLCNLSKSSDGNAPNLDTQSDLLTFIEGTDVIFTKDSGSKEYPSSFNTSNVLIICGGAFDMIQQEKKKEIQKKSHQIGFSLSNEEEEKDENTNLLANITTDDIIKAGLMPELVGRLQVRCIMDKLDIETYKNILLNSKNSVVKQYEKLLELNGIKLSFSEESIDSIVEKAIKIDLGARSLKSIVDKVMFNVMFNIQPEEKNLIITKEMVDDIDDTI